MSQHLTPQLSVVLCSAGAGTHLGAQLAALSDQQTDLSWELLFVDNGCTEASLRTVREWLPRLPAGRIVDATRQRGPAFGRNTGAEAASAPLVAFCDDDDVVSPQWVSAMHQALGSAELVGGSLHVDRLNTSNVQSWRDRPQADDLYAFPGYLPFVMSCNMGVHRRVFLDVGGFDANLYPGEDVDLSWKIQAAGGRAAFSPDAVLHYRYRDSLREHLRQQWAYGQSSALLKLAYPLPGPAGRHLRVMSRALLALLLHSWVALRSSGDRNRYLGTLAFWAGEVVTLRTGRAKIARRTT